MEFLSRLFDVLTPSHGGVVIATTSVLYKDLLFSCRVLVTRGCRAMLMELVFVHLV